MDCIMIIVDAIKCIIGCFVAATRQSDFIVKTCPFDSIG
jgi:hypothetical protein